MKIIYKEGEEALALLKAEITQMVKAAVIEVISQVKDTGDGEQHQLWCNTKRAQQILGVKKTKMQQIRDLAPDNGIRISKQGRTYRYFIPSLYGYLENHTGK